MGRPTFDFTSDMPLADFERLSRLIYEESAICMPESKRTMLTARIHKRMKTLGIMEYKKYVDYVLSPEGLRHELKPLLDHVTTNKTDFFREPDHFEFLKNRVASDVLARVDTHPRVLKVWSAGCSSGQEPYTIAMVMSEFFETNRGDFSILATDLSERVLEAGRRAVYREQDIGPVPPAYRKKYLMKGINEKGGLYRVVPELRKKVRFDRLNLTAEGAFPLAEAMDIIFCRNVTIYFDRDTQQKLYNKFYNVVKPGGYIFIGHSESLNGICNRLDSLGSAVYQRPLHETTG